MNRTGWWWTWVFAGCAASVAGCAGSSAEQRTDKNASARPSVSGPVVVNGQGFSLQLPPGLRVLTDAQAEQHGHGVVNAVKSGGAALASVEGGPPGLILLLPAGAPLPTPLSAEACREFATRMAAAAQATLQSAELARLPAGDACRFSLAVPGGQVVENTFLSQEGLGFGLQCLHGADADGILGLFSVVQQAWMFSAPTHVTGRGFRIPLPTGFVPSTGRGAETARAQGGVALQATQRPGLVDGFLASIVVIPAPADPASAPTPQGCALTADQLFRNIGGTLEKSEVATFSTGPACRISMKGAEGSHHRATFVIRTIGSAAYVVTCNADDRDSSTDTACSAVVEGLRAP